MLPFGLNSFGTLNLLNLETDDCFVYGKDRQFYGEDRNEAAASNVENAEDCQFICQE